MGRKENRVESLLYNGVKPGGMSFKFISPGKAGVPDRLVCLPGGEVHFVELKADGGRPSKLQKRRISRFRKPGSEAAVLTGREEVLHYPDDNRENVPRLADYDRNAWRFDMVVVDELSGFKSSKALRLKSLCYVRPHIKRPVGLTGTPAGNGLIDLCISMRAEDYPELPECVTVVIPVYMDRRTKTRYEEFEREMLLEIDENTLDAGTAAVLPGKLMQFADGAVYDENMSVVEIHSGNPDTLPELIEGLNGQHAPPEALKVKIRELKAKTRVSIKCKKKIVGAAAL